MTVVVRAMGDADLPAVGRFLSETLNPRVSAAAWAAALRVPWKVDAPNFGYVLVDTERPAPDGAAETVVGAHLAFYSEREVDGRRERICNLGAWCVAEAYRFHGVKLLRALLRQEGYTFTDLSPSGAVIPLNERLGFRFLDTTTVVVACLPWPLPAGRVRIRTGAAVQPHLFGRDAEIYEDHADAAAARHVLLTRGDHSCYVIYRRDRRKGLALFASVLYVSDAETFRRVRRTFFRHLLGRGVLAALCEVRIVGTRPRGAFRLRSPRRKMFKSTTVGPHQVDDLYSELTCVAW